MAAAVAMLLLAVGAVLLAEDVRSWRDTLRDDSVRFAIAPTGPQRWTAPTVLPAGLSGRILAVGPDRARLSTLRLFTRAYSAVFGVPPQYITAAQHRLVDNALASLNRASQSTDPVRASQAFNLLALLQLSTIRNAFGDFDVAAANSAVANLENAVRADHGNTHAKVNLELELRALARNPAYNALEPGGDKASGKRKGAAGKPTGTGY
jgi:hypothetical protein